MRSLRSLFRRALPGTLAAGLAVSGTLSFAPAPAQADRLRDHATADSFGNLVVWSRSGYKRIVVGQGHLAAELNDYVGGDNLPRVVYGAEHDGIEDGYAAGDDGLRYDRRHRYHSGFYNHGCYSVPTLVKGRSYMYGLAEGELPVLAPCVDYGD